MTAINVTSINVLDNPSKVTNPLQFEIQYECLYDLADGAPPPPASPPPGRPPPPRAASRAAPRARAAAPIYFLVELFPWPLARQSHSRKPRAPLSAAPNRPHPPRQNFSPLHLPPHSAADLEWRLTYVGSAESEKYDQVLDAVFVGPVAPGQYRFVFQVRRAGGGCGCGGFIIGLLVLLSVALLI